MILNQLHASYGATKKRKKRGRGRSSGHGKTSCRGSKGLLSRSGGGLRHGFEGGQMPLIRRIPKRGFRRKKNHVYQIVNLDSLNKIKDKDIILPEEMKACGLIKNITDPVKILGNGKLSKSVTVNAHAFSASAAEKIKRAGGKIKIIKEEKKKNVTSVSKSV